MLYTTKRPPPSPPKGSLSLLISHPSYFTLYPQLVHLRDADPLDVMAVEQQAIHSGFFFKALIFFPFHIHIKPFLPSKPLAGSSHGFFPAPPPPSKQNKMLLSSPNSTNLQGVGKKFVHLRKSRRDAEIDCSVSDFNDKPTEDIGVDLVPVSHTIPSHFSCPLFLGIWRGRGGSRHTLLVTFNFLPCPTYWLLLTAASNLWSVFESNALALVTVSSTSPFAALISSPNFSEMPFSRLNRL